MQQTKTTRISALESWIKIKLNKDTKNLAKIDFDDLPDEDAWLNIQISLQAQNKKIITLNQNSFKKLKNQFRFVI